MIKSIFVQKVFAACSHNATGTTTSCTTITSPFGPVGLPSILGTVYTLFMFIVGLVFFILIIVSGIKIISSGGNREKIAGAQKTLVAAIIGLVIILLASVILKLLGGLIPGGQNLGL
ncbi:MAG: hypothetical protein ACYDBX_04165 [Patescibacteria group bacterium]